MRILSSEGLLRSPSIKSTLAVWPMAVASVSATEDFPSLLWLDVTIRRCTPRLFSVLRLMEVLKVLSASENLDSGLLIYSKNVSPGCSTFPANRGRYPRRGIPSFFSTSSPDLIVLLVSSNTRPNATDALKPRIRAIIAVLSNDVR